MAKLVGIVSKVVGQVVAIAEDGTRRVLVEGDRVFAGEQLETGAAGAVAVHLQNGAELTLGRDSSLELSPQLLANHAPHVDAPQTLTPSAAQLTDVEKLQQAIAAGGDPSQDADPTAAGPGNGGAPGAAGGGHSFVLLSEVGDRVDPLIGFPTAGFNGFPELRDVEVGLINHDDDSAAPLLPPSGDNPISLDGLSTGGSGLTLNEAHLAQGSASDPSALTQTGSFTVVSPDGLFNLNVGGINVVTGGVVTGVGQSITTGLGNVLTITGYDAATGQVSYSYTLTGADTHSTGGGTNGLSESIAVSVSDSDGDVANGSLQITVIDDVPLAVADSNPVAASEAQLTLTGNVLTNDIQGADRIPSGPITAGTFTGTYGTLVLAADGTYTYTLNSNDPDFIKLHGGGSGVETFTYTLNDADGDKSTATLTLNINNLNDPVTLNGLNTEGGEVTVYEKHLGDGSNPDAAALTQSGSFTVGAPDGLQSLTVGGINVVSNGVAAGFPQSTTTPQGNTLTITGYNPGTGVVTYTYTLLDNEAHASGKDANELKESFAVTATDGDGSTATGSLDVNIVDDVPKAIDDTNTGTASESQLTLTGNVLTNDIQGADRITSGPITAGSFKGTYGTLDLAADGTYTYTLNSSDPDFIKLNGTQSDTFTYTLNDADGDTSTATLTLNVSGVNNPVTITGLDICGGEITFYEKNLSDGSSPDAGALTSGGIFTVTAPDGLKTLTIGDISLITNGVVSDFPLTGTTPMGNSVIIHSYDPVTGVVTGTYTLEHRGDHSTGDGETVYESLIVVAVDKDGSEATASVDINIVDDAPKAVADTNTGTASETQLTLTGNVLDNDIQGADRIPSGPITAGKFTGTYGTLDLAADGTYTYTLNSNDPDFIKLHGGGSGVETFTYTLNDADGDKSTATLTLNINNLNDPVTLNGLNTEGGEVTVYEKHLGDGSNPDAAALTQSGSFTVGAPDGLQSLTVGGINVVSNGVAAGFPQSTTTPQGNTLTITGYNPGTGVVTYTYTLLDNEAHAAGKDDNDLKESFVVTATDGDGSTATGSLDVIIVDDVPKAVADTNTGTASESQLTLTGNVLDNDIQGADRIPSGPITAGKFTGTYGTLDLAADGTYTYTLNSSDPDFIKLNGTQSDTFTYTLNDADGDTSTATLTLNVSGVNNPVTITGLDICGGEITFYEKNLSDGSSPDAGALTSGGIFTVTAPDGLKTLTIGDISLITNGVVSDFPMTGTTPMGNSVIIHSYDPVTGVVTGTYTLEHSGDHSTGDGETVYESLIVVAVDKDGSEATASVDINIVDDAPKAVADTNTGTASESQLTLTGNVLTNDIQGADRITSGPITAGSFKGTYGTLDLAADGTYTYTLNSNDPDFIKLNGTQSDTFTYTLNDADGDTSTSTLTLNVSNGNSVDHPVTITGLDLCGGEITVYEKNLSDGSSPDAGALTSGGIFTVTAPDGLKSLTIGDISIVTNGVVSDFPMTGSTPWGNSMTIHSYDPDTGVVTGTYTLVHGANHPGTNSADSLVEQITVVAVDTNGSSSSAIIDVNIVDDVPSVIDAERSVSPGQVDTNLLLTIDVSGSMNDASGVGWLTRLEFAKDAIGVMLDKYDAMGDVKVQIVTFNSTSTVQATSWVTVAEAKDIVKDLKAERTTDYDAAVSGAESAFNTSGKLTGAQNVSYFFSDGEPSSPSQGIGTKDEAAWKEFLDANGIKSYAIGLGNGVNAENLNPLAYDGSTHTNTNSTIVTDLNQLHAVLSDTVQGGVVFGSLMSGGEFGADGGFIKSLVIDGTTYTFDPKGNEGAGSYTASGLANRGAFDTISNSLTVKTAIGGSLVVNMDSGDFTYTPPKTNANGADKVEKIGFVVSDNDGDTHGANLAININSNAVPVAGADHIITNILSGSINVPGEALLANDSDANQDLLSASLTANTQWAARGADFTVGTSAAAISFDNTKGKPAGQLLEVARSSFTGASASMTAAVVVSGFLGAVSNASAEDEDLIKVNLKAGEKLTLDHNLAGTQNLMMEWKDASGIYHPIADGGSFTAGHDGVYTIHLVNKLDASAVDKGAAEKYDLTMSIDYAGAHDSTPQYNGTYTVSDGHGGSSLGAVDITYQAGATLAGTAHDDVLVAADTATTLNAGDGNDVLVGGSGDDSLQGGNGNDLLIGGLGNDLLDGGAGTDTASYASALAAVKVDLSATGPQNTGGGGADTLSSIENLIGSDYNDILTGNNSANLLVGGKGNDTLSGGGGADTFLWQQGNTGHDVVTDFNPGADRLDLSQLLQGESATSASLDDYLHFKVTGSGTNVVSTIEVSAVAGAAPTQTIELAGVDLAQHYGVTAGAGGVISAGHDTATIINGMLNDHSLKVDTV